MSLGLVSFASCLALAAGCSSSSKAAEPAVAPTGTAPAAGRVVPIGSSPEGIVFDATTNLLAVAVRDPDRLLLVDPTTLKSQRSVPLPGAVRHLQLKALGGPVLVPCQDADRLLEVALPSAAVVADVAVGGHPHDATDVGGLVVVGNEFGHSLSVVEGTKVVRTITGSEQPGGVIRAGRYVAVIDVDRFTLALVNPMTGRHVAILPAGAGPTHGVATSDGTLVVADTRGGQLLTYSLDPFERTGSYRLPGSPYGIALDDRTDTVWVTLTDSNELVGLHITAGSLHEIARYPTVEQPNTVAVAPGGHQIWVTGTRQGELERIDR